MGSKTKSFFSRKTEYALLPLTFIADALGGIWSIKPKKELIIFFISNSLGILLL